MPHEKYNRSPRLGFLVQFRDLESPSSPYSYKLWGLYVVHKLTRGKRESVVSTYLLAKCRNVDKQILRAIGSSRHRGSEIHLIDKM